MTDHDLTRRVMDFMIKSTDFVQIHQHIDGRCVKSYAYKDDDGVYQFVVANERGEVVELRPITNVVAWAREQIEGHAFRCSRERLESRGAGHA